MGRELDLITTMHQATQRNYLARATSEKPQCVEVAKEFGFDYWDGDRKYGFGGYHYDGRWRRFAQSLIENYKLDNGSRILDIGCGKGFLLFELVQLLPGSTVRGVDISNYAIENAKSEVKHALEVRRAQDAFPYPNLSFDLVLSINTLHNLKIYDLVPALREIQRLGTHQYVVNESYRTERERFNLLCWNLTGECMFDPREWNWIFEQAGYQGDFDFIFFD